MTFEEALFFELNSELNGNVFPIHAVQSTEAPFLTYRKYDVDFEVNLNGPSTKIDGVYEIDILHRSYGELQSVFKLVKTKIISFLGRNIGDNGPLIEYLTVSNLVDLYEPELDYNRLNFKIHVKYKEV